MDWTALGTIVAAMGSIGAAVFLMPQFIQSLQKPRLEVGYDSKSKADHLLEDWIRLGETGNAVRRQILRVRVTNEGGAIAMKCRAYARILGVRTKCSGVHLSRKRLTWESGETEISLPANGGAEFLNVVIAQRRMMELGGSGIYCAEDEAEETGLDLAPVVGYLATQRSFSGKEGDTDDYLCKGEFDIELTIHSEEGATARKVLTVKMATERYCDDFPTMPDEGEFTLEASVKVLALA